MDLDALIRATETFEKAAMTREELLVRALVRIRAIASDELSDSVDWKEALQAIVIECNELLRK